MLKSCARHYADGVDPVSEVSHIATMAGARVVGNGDAVVSDNKEESAMPEEVRCGEQNKK